MTIWFDMDGTIADLYSVENWLPMLLSYDTTPYRKAETLGNFSYLARLLNKAVRAGYEIGVISWGSKEAPAFYDEAVRAEKIKWIKKHLPSVNFSTIQVVHYGTPKSSLRTSSMDILFDDEERNRIEWGKNSFEPKDIYNVLKSLF